jgi:hypothetical protein
MLESFLSFKLMAKKKSKKKVIEEESESPSADEFEGELEKKKIIENENTDKWEEFAEEEGLGPKARAREGVGNDKEHMRQQAKEAMKEAAQPTKASKTKMSGEPPSSWTLAEANTYMRMIDKIFPDPNDPKRLKFPKQKVLNKLEKELDSGELSSGKAAYFQLLLHPSEKNFQNWKKQSSIEKITEKRQAPKANPKPQPSVKRAPIQKRVVEADALDKELDKIEKAASKKAKPIYRSQPAVKKAPPILKKVAPQPQSDSIAKAESVVNAIAEQQQKQQEDYSQILNALFNIRRPKSDGTEENPQRKYLQWIEKEANQPRAEPQNQRNEEEIMFEDEEVPFDEEPVQFVDEEIPFEAVNEEPKAEKDCGPDKKLIKPLGKPGKRPFKPYCRKKTQKQLLLEEAQSLGLKPSNRYSANVIKHYLDYFKEKKSTPANIRELKKYLREKGIAIGQRKKRRRGNLTVKQKKAYKKLEHIILGSGKGAKKIVFKDQKRKLYREESE